jgi:hypothetical protein
VEEVGVVVVVLEVVVVVLVVVAVLEVVVVVVLEVVLVLPQPANEILNTITITRIKNTSLFILSFHSFDYSSNQFSIFQDIHHLLGTYTF